jgi:predicted nucleic acid-binding protein
MKPVWVLDTNVLVSAALTAGGTCDQVLRAAIAGRVTLAWSAPMIAEYREVLLRPRVCLATKPGQRERERVLGQGDRGGGGPAARAAKGNAGPAPFLASLEEQRRWSGLGDQTHPRFKLSPSAVSALLAAFDPAHQFPVGVAPALPDSDDEVFLAAALATTDRILVTGNTAHFPLKLCHPVKVLTPSAALQSLNVSA